MPGGLKLVRISVDTVLLKRNVTNEGLIIIYNSEIFCEDNVFFLIIYLLQTTSRYIVI
jgi:hypothetical protein